MRALMNKRRRAREAQRGDPSVDHGAIGPAYVQRPSRMVETIQAGVKARQYEDATLADRMARAAQLSDRQYEAAKWVLEQYEAAGFEPSVTANYQPFGSGRGHDDETEEPPAIGRFRRLLGGCSRGAGDLLLGMCLGQHPGVRRLGSLQAALKDIADRRGLP